MIISGDKESEKFEAAQSFSSVQVIVENHLYQSASS